jgi:hypothetical protein
MSSYHEATGGAWDAYLAAHEQYKAAHADYVAAQERTNALRGASTDPTTPDGMQLWQAEQAEGDAYQACHAAGQAHDAARADWDLAHNVALWAQGTTSEQVMRDYYARQRETGPESESEAEAE